MQNFLTHRNVGGNPIGLLSQGTAAPASLIEVLWRRRWTLVLTVAILMLGAAIYLTAATRVYSSSSTVLIQQNTPKAFSENTGFVAPSETFLQTQADVFRSTPVLTRALDAAGYRTMKTFAKAGTDPVAWLRNGHGFKVDVPRKSDTVVVTMESTNAEEAATFVNSITAAYLVEQSQQKQTTGEEMVRVLQKEKNDLLARRDACLASLLKLKLDKGVLSFKDDKNNIAVERVVALANSVNTAEVATMELRAQEKSTREAISNPASLVAFVAALQTKGRDSGDQEYDDLRRQLVQQALAMGQNNPVLGATHPRMQMLRSIGDELKKRIDEKNLAIAQAQLVLVTTQLKAAEEKERQLRVALKAQADLALGLSPAATECGKLEAQATTLQKQLDVVDARIGEVSVNSANGGPANAQVLESARPSDSPIKPNKMLVMAGAMIMGWVLGIGLAMLRDWQDVRLRKPDEIRSLLGTPVVAMVPRINMKLSPVTRGQMVRLDARSPVAEAYRSARTSLHLGISSKAKTILVASPMEGDGKSTTASNLAIAFAQAGERTLLIDCDLREPVQHLIFEAEGRLGLSSVVAGEATLQNAIAPTGVAGLHLLPCGPVPVNPSELLTSKRFERLMRSLGESFDRIVIDSAPLMMFTDAQVLAASADVTLLVLRMNQSMRQLGMMAMDSLAKVGANVVGAVANDVAPPKGYRKYGGAWQYATQGRFNGGKAVEVRAAIREPGRIASEVLTIREPDWSMDTQ
jgi:succinoglycan biosynthesis transport protein ExoP